MNVIRLRQAVRMLSFASAIVMASHVTVPAFAYAKVAPDPAAAQSTTKRAAIVIDDLGNGMSGTEEIMSAPIRLTVAIMPFLPTSKRDAEWAHRVGHDVIVHMPMEPLRGNKKGLGPGAVFTDLPDDEIRKRVEAAIDDIPHAIGINNHMGSKVTADLRVMRIVMDVCKRRELFFLDSKTNYRSVAAVAGQEIGVKVLQNHIFLDDVSSIAHIAKQFQLIQKHLSEHEPCIAIGHVGISGKKTASVLHKSADQLQDEIRFVRISELVDSLKLP